MASNTDAILAKYGVSRDSKESQQSNTDDILAKYGVSRADVKSNGGAATPSPSPTPAVSEDKDEDKGNFWDKILGFAGFTGEKFASGAAESAEGIYNTTGYMGQMEQRDQAVTNAGFTKALGDIFGIKKLQDIGAQELETSKAQVGKPLETATDFGDKYAAKVEEKYADADIGKVGRFVGDVAQGVGGLVPSIAANAIVPGGGTAALAMGIFGNSMQEAKNSGADDITAAAYGIANTAVETVTEKLLGGMKLGGKKLFGTGFLDKAKDMVLGKVGSSGTKRLLNVALSALGEGAEEFIAEYGNLLANKLTIGTDQRVWNSLETLGDAAYNAFVGGIIGGIMNVGNNVSDSKPIDPKEAAEMAAEEAATEIKNAMPTQGEISPSDGVSAEPTTYTANAENVGRANQGEPGFETANVDGEHMAESADYYGKSTGAATPNIGPMVETQNKAITENVNLGEESIAANQPAPHEQISEALSLARAGAMLYTDSEGNVVNFDETLDDLMNKEGNWTGVESDAVQLLLKEAERRGDADAVKRIAERMAKEGTDLGQALQSRQKWISAEPASRLAAMYQTVAKFAEKHKAIKGGKIEIPDFLAKAYLEADSEVKRDEIIGDIQEYVAQQSRSGLMEKWTALRYTNMLGNFKTQIRNLAGNTTMLLTTRAKDMVGTLAEAIYGKERTKSAFVGKEWMRAAKADYANAKKRIMSYGKYTDENFKGDFAEGIEDKRKILPVGLEQYRKATNWAMETGDTIFSKAVYSRALAGFLKANGVAPEQLAAGTVDSALMEKARAYAVKQAQEATFRDSNAFSDWASTFLRAEDTPEAIKVLGEGLMPFRRTPANVLARAVEYSPLGVVNTAVKAAKAHKGDGDVTASDVIDSLAKTITGTGLAVLGYLLSDMGLLRASGDEEDEGIDALMGRQDWSLVIPGVGSYTFDWAAPTSLIMFTGAALHEMTSDEGLTFSDLEGALTSLTEPLIQMSMLSGINDTLDSIKYSDNNLLQMAGQLAAGYLTQGLTNTLLGQIERSAEDVRMSTYTEADSPLPEWLQRTIGKASAKTPGWDYQQTEYLNEFGETEDSGSVAQRLIENLLSPGYWESAKEGEPVYDFAQDAYDSLGINAFPDAYAPKSISYDGTTHVLTQEQREAYQRTQGQTAKELMEAAQRSGAYDALGDDAKRDVISELLSFAREQGKRNALGISGDMSEKEKAIAALSPNDMVKYFSLEAATNAMDKDGATNEEISAMQNLIDSPISKSVAEIIMDGDFKKMYDADKAGISVRQFSTISANMDTLKTPAGYTNKPNWQKYGVIAGSNLDDGKKLELIGIYGGESAYNNFSEALGKGYSFDRVVDFYEAYTRKNADGTSKDAADKKAAALAAGFTEAQYLALKRIFS